MNHLPRPLLAYLAIALLHLAAVVGGLSWAASATKPLVMAALLWYWRSERGPAGTAGNWITAALLFSLCGDVLLDLAKYQPAQQAWFLAGVAAFLMAQLSYAVGFQRFPPRGKGLVQYHPWWLIPLLAYLITFFWTLWPGIPSGLRAPIVVYGLAISAMVASAMNLGGRLPASSYRLVVWGAMSFLLSDSLIGLSRFRPEAWGWPLPQFWIMLTYIAGQALIVIGLRSALSARAA